MTFHKFHFYRSPNADKQHGGYYEHGSSNKYLTYLIINIRNLKDLVSNFSSVQSLYWFQNKINFCNTALEKYSYHYTSLQVPERLDLVNAYVFPTVWAQHWKSKLLIRDFQFVGASVY